MSRDLGRTCFGCGKGITDQSKTGRCRSCNLSASHADPEMNARRMAALTVALRTDEVRARKSNAAKRVWSKPEMREKMSMSMKAALADPAKAANHRAASRENLRRWHQTTDIDWSAHHKARARATAPWCPADRYDELLKLSKALGRAEAERVLKEDIVAKERAMTPFERQMARVAAGAKLVEVRPLRRADHDFTLGGVAPEAL